MRSLHKLVLLSFLSIIISTFAHVSPALPKKTASPIVKNGPTQHKWNGFVDPLLKEWCNKSIYPDANPHLCVSTIAPHINGKPTLQNALDIAIKAAMRYTNKTIDVAKEIYKAPPPLTKMELKDALEILDEIFSGYKRAQDYATQHKFGELTNEFAGIQGLLVSALEPYGPDPNGLIEIKVPAVRTMLHKGQKMVEVCFTFSDLLHPEPISY